jgi:putative tricarboxylic transport membrane protein
MEQNLRRALAISDGHVAILFQSPVSITLWVLAAAALSMPFLLRRMKPAG